MADFLTDLKNNKRSLFLLFWGALLLRLVFSFYLQKYYFGAFTFKYKDTDGYLLPILNWLEHGIFQVDLYLPDSKYFRVPVYPLFLGVFHQIFGPDSFQWAVAFVQCVLDAVSALLVFLLVLRISQNKGSATASGWVYASYPFVILWNPILYTEVLMLFLAWILFISVVYGGSGPRKTVLQGLLCGVLVLTKQYMGVMILVPFFYQFFQGAWRKSVLTGALLGAGLLLALSPWVARNYLDSGRLIVLRGETSGFRELNRDMESFYRFASLFDENVTPAIQEVSKKGQLTLLKHPEFVRTHTAQIQDAVAQAHQCGDSFIQWREWRTVNEPPFVGCAYSVAEKFDRLTQTFWAEVSWWEAMQTRWDAVYKIVGKNDLVNKDLAMSRADRLKAGIFAYRVLLLALGVIGVVLLFKAGRSRRVLPFVATALVFYVYFTIISIHAEMRYLLVPDVMLSVFAGVTLLASWQRLARLRTWRVQT